MTGRNWVAALLSLLVTGLGQVLNGRMERAAFLFGGWLVSMAVGLRLPLLLPWSISLLAVFTPDVLKLLSVVDAAIDDPAKGARSRASLSLVAGLGVALLVTAIGWAWIMREANVQAFKIPAGSMEPAILVGDHLVVDRASYGLRNPFTGRWLWKWRDVGRGEVVVFPFPEDPSRMFLKRVVGLPGERVEIRKGVVLIEGKPLDEPYARFLEPPVDDGPRDHWGPETVPEGQVFLLGDNRQNSRDSRYWGCIPVDDVLGEAKVVYWSWDPSAQRTRWSRLGLRIR